MLVYQRVALHVALHEWMVALPLVGSQGPKAHGSR